MRPSARLVGLIVVVGFHAQCVAAGPPRLELDIHYGPDPLQVLDLFLPEGRGFRTVVYTYGGGWHSGSGKSSRPIAEALTHMGYACALVSHRVFPPDPFTAPTEDLAAAFAWVEANIDSRGGDAHKVVLAGHSSGAQLSLLIATDPRYLRGWRLAPSDIRAVIGLSPPVDLTRHPDGHGYGDVLLSGHGADPFLRDQALMELASPIRHISQSMPPVLLVVGERDFPMLMTDARSFARKAAGLGKVVQVVVAPEKDHLGVARGMADQQDFAFNKVLSFLRTQIKE